MTGDHGGRRTRHGARIRVRCATTGGFVGSGGRSGAVGDQRAWPEPGGAGRPRARRRSPRLLAVVSLVLAVAVVVTIVVGTAVLTGVVALVGLAVGAGTVLLTRGTRAAVRAVHPVRRRAPADPAGQPPGRLPAHLSARHAAHPSVRAAALARPPVRDLSMEELGREWRRTAAALATTTDPATRGLLVRRRQEALDELERRDPAGVARWLSRGATVDGDPAHHLRGDQAAGPGAC